MRYVKKIKTGSVTLGNGNVYIQSMLNTPSDKHDLCVAQAKSLEEAGCEIIRIAVPEIKDAVVVSKLKEAINIPVVADIHFNYETALEAVAAGADKIRINPGNIGDDENIRRVCEACAKKGIPIRVGVNSGSLEKDIYALFGGITPEALAMSAKRNIEKLENFGFDSIVVSMKSSNVPLTVAAYRILAAECCYPLHLGITEAGTAETGIIKSAIGIGALLLDGIGDTIRVSLTADPLTEIKAAKDILCAVGLRKGAEVISCPTCGRTKIDVIGLAEQVEKAVQEINFPLKIAVMGCAVNGPGEAREADVGIAGGNGEGLIFRKGEVMKKVKESELLNCLLSEIKDIEEQGK